MYKNKKVSGAMPAYNEEEYCYCRLKSPCKPFAGQMLAIARRTDDWGGVQMPVILVILSCAILSAIAQIFLKFGMSNLDKNPSLSIAFVPSLITNAYVVFGAALYGISFILWLYVLSKVNVSYAYPFISLSYIIVAILSFLMLGEKISFGAWIGICLVGLGVALIGMNIGS